VSAPRLYAAELAGALVPGASIALPATAAHHAASVLRLRTRDAVTLFTGEGGEFPATIERIDRREVIIRVDAFADAERESALAATLVQSVAAGDAMDYAIRKSVELGAAALQPVITARSAPLGEGTRAVQKRERWQNVAIAACEQSGRNRVPAVGAPIPLAQWLARRAVASPGIVLAPQGGVPLTNVTAPKDAIDVLVGPEGGFTIEEVAAATRAGLAAVRLGPRVLRTETAGPAALAAIQMLWGDFR